MADLSIAGVNVNVLRDTVDETQHEVGGARRRMFNGDYRSTARGWRRTWGPFTTTLLTSAEKTALEAVLKSLTQPLFCTGAAIGGVAVDCFAEYHGAKYVGTNVGGVAVVKYQLRFSLHEE